MGCLILRVTQKRGIPPHPHLFYLSLDALLVVERVRLVQQLVLLAHLVPLRVQRLVDLVRRHLCGSKQPRFRTWILETHIFSLDGAEVEIGALCARCGGEGGALCSLQILLATSHRNAAHSPQSDILQQVFVMYLVLILHLLVRLASQPSSPALPPSLPSSAHSTRSPSDDSRPQDSNLQWSKHTNTTLILVLNALAVL